jgi:hypothetical protein
MIRYDRAKAKVLTGIINTLAAASDVGLRQAGEAPLGLNPRCDLCVVRLKAGRLLVSAWGIGHIIHDDGTVAFGPWLAEDPLDAQYLVCPPCHRLLRRDHGALLQRLLEVYQGGGRN